MPDIGIVGARISGLHLALRRGSGERVRPGPAHRQGEALRRKVEMEMCEVLGAPQGAAAWLEGFQREDVDA